jgi:hypothetical protein
MIETRNPCICANCERYEWKHGKGACTIDGRERAQGFGCASWVQTLDTRCGTCMGEGKIWKDNYLWPCPSCDPNGIDFRGWVLNKDITNEMRQAHKQLIQNISMLAAAVPQRGGYTTPKAAAEMGIRICSDCGKPNPVERSHCKGCDAVMNFKTKKK